MPAVSVLCCLWLCLGVCGTQAILVGGRSADNSTADQASQHSKKRSTYEYYPEDTEVSGYGFDLEPPHHHPHYPHPSYHPPHHGSDNALRALLLPLAGVALLGAAAVFASNPVLLQLGVISGRRRRELRNQALAADRLRDLLQLQSMLSQLPQEQVEREHRRLLGSYLTCPSVQSAVCVDRIVCQLSQTADSSSAERRILDMIFNEVMNNEFINKEIKKGVVRARRAGNNGEDCRTFPCTQLDEEEQKEKYKTKQSG